MNALSLAAASAAAVLLVLPTPALAAPAPAKCVDGRSDSRGRSSVDGRELAWDDASKFDDALRYAARVWSAGSMTRVTIKPDDATSWADVEWRDVSSTGPHWYRVYGRWSAQHGTDRIELNAAYLGGGKSLGQAVHRRRVAAHELGHALGFCHKSLVGDSLMWEQYGDIRAGKIDRPTARDVADYHRLWG
ncbi:matrixin family metalloprotease [Streptomyces sp. NPDC048717]|uniref:matrixin family metalloprotease n=1 Tax=Streptomyces sp. NPDC048717 TaxID=3154928 RepID=UPI00341E5979